MMKKIFAASGVALLASLLVLVLLPATASAHEKRHVGNYTFVVGFLDEPAYAQAKNSLDLTICNGGDCTYTVTDGARVVSNPVNNADKTLKVEVSMGGVKPLALAMEPRWANPGKYNAYFMPAKTGAYTFHIFGTLENKAIDEKFTSSPTGFNEVQAIQAYPANSSQEADPQIAGLKNSVKDAQNSASTATTFGIIGSILGVLGLGAAAYALTRRPRVVPAVAETKTPAESLRG